MNPWVQFLKEHRGKGLKINELRNLYESEKANTPIVYNYDINADDKDSSALESVIEDYDIPALTQKLNEHDDLTEEEKEQWLIAFELVLSDEYALTKQQLFNSHDAWLNAIDNIDELELDVIIDRLQSAKHKDIYALMDDITSSFTLEQLHSIEFAELQ
jgi:hypothetical protein